MTQPSPVVLALTPTHLDTQRINLGGNVANFGSATLTVGQRLEWCLNDAKETLQAAPEGRASNIHSIIHMFVDLISFQINLSPNLSRARQILCVSYENSN